MHTIYDEILRIPPYPKRTLPAEQLKHYKKYYGSSFDVISYLLNTYGLGPEEHDDDKFRWVDAYVSFFLNWINCIEEGTLL